MIRVQIENVTFAYGTRSIMSDVSRTFSSGERICLLGENGAGKTTLLKVLASLLKPSEGTIHYFDEDFELDHSAFRKKLGIQLDDSHLLRQFTVMENIGLYQQLYTGKNDIDKINHWLDLFDLQLHRESHVQNLSQGEQKKLSLIKAFLHEPSMIILDEPTNSLDHVSKEKLETHLRSLPLNCLLLVSTHDPSWTKSWSTKELVIKDGKLS